MKPLLAIAGALVLAGPAQAADYTLNFDPATACAPLAACTDFATVSQAFGDVSGVVDVTYIDVGQAATTTGLSWWDSNYNDLRGVLWATGGDAESHARIEIKSLNGGAVTLNAMDFGAYAFNTLGTNIVVSALGTGTELFNYSGTVGLGDAHTSFAPAVTAAGGIAIEWRNSAYNVGIDNVSFSVTAVPEPEALAMLLVGLGVVAAASRRRRAGKTA